MRMKSMGQPSNSLFHEMRRKSETGKKTFHPKIGSQYLPQGNGTAVSCKTFLEIRVVAVLPAVLVPAVLNAILEQDEVKVTLLLHAQQML